MKILFFLIALCRAESQESQTWSEWLGEWVDAIWYDVAEPSTQLDYYAHTLLDSTTEILELFDVKDTTLFHVKDAELRDIHEIKWTQHYLCGLWQCEGKYYEFEYTKNGNAVIDDAEAKPFRVFVAEEEMKNTPNEPPESFQTNDFSGKLYAAYFPLYYDNAEDSKVLVFVIQPSDREIFQKRFHMGLDGWVEYILKAVGKHGGKAVGGVVGSILPGIGTALGVALGTVIDFGLSAAAGTSLVYLSNNYTGDFLRFVA